MRNKVVLISGGGSGHEPAHAGFVGKGMLTAAVAGDVFASPPPSVILEGICQIAKDNKSIDAIRIVIVAIVTEIGHI